MSLSARVRLTISQRVRVLNEWQRNKTTF